MNTISRTLARLKPADLFPACKWIVLMEQCGDMKAGEAKRWKEGIYPVTLAHNYHSSIGVRLDAPEPHGSGP